MPDLLGSHGWRAPDALTPCPRGRQALVGALHDQFADELRECGEDMCQFPKTPAWMSEVVCVITSRLFMSSSNLPLVGS